MPKLTTTTRNVCREILYVGSETKTISKLSGAEVVCCVADAGIPVLKIIVLVRFWIADKFEIGYFR